MKTAVDKGRSTKPGLELGICGEHGGDPESIWKCEAIGLDYVSCSPFRVPVARLAAAQAAMAGTERDKSRELISAGPDGAGDRVAADAQSVRPPLAGRQVRDVVGPPHRRVDDGLEIGVVGDGASPSSRAAAATASAIARVTDRSRSTVG